MRAAAVLILLAATARADSLAVLDRGAWRDWWSSERAPVRWPASSSTLQSAIAWERLQPGLESADVRIAAAAPASRLRLILLRIEPRSFDWRLVESHTDEGKSSWKVDDVPPETSFAFNAGQFSNHKPWGWIVRDGAEVQAPGRGPLSMALVVDASGAAALIDAREIEAIRRRGGIVTAFQSYPTLLDGDGVVPEVLRAPDRGVDLGHRDSRLAIGELRDGRIVVALTRFDIGDGLLRPVPIGPNVPEMVAIMGGLGCRKAVMLDGGISSQLLARPSAGEARIWTAYRRVPLGMIAVPRREPTAQKMHRTRPPAR